MAKANPLKKITAEAKRIRKSKPNTSWKSAVKQAGVKYRTGKIRKPRRKKVSSVGSTRKKAVKKKKSRSRGKRPVTAVAVRKTTTTMRARRVGRSAPVKRHRMAGSGSKGGGVKTLLTVGILAGAAYLLWKALKPAAPQLPPGTTATLYQSQNQQRNDQSNQIVQYAIAAGLTVDAISRLIESLNQSRDADVSNIYDELDRGGELPATLYA